jgi:hypothetical protein
MEINARDDSPPLWIDISAVCATAYPTPVCPSIFNPIDCISYLEERAKCFASANVIADALESDVLGIPQKAWEDGQLKHTNCCR